MSVKSVIQTRWKIEPNRVIIYPYGLSYILSVVFAVIFFPIIFFYARYQNTSIFDSMPLLSLLLLIVVLLWGYASTSVEFDNQKGKMKKKLMGFISFTTIPFAKLQGISPVSNLYGSYKYHLFRKDNKYGKGILVSCGYTKIDDPNAVAFVENAAAVIHNYLTAHDSPAHYVLEPTTAYQYFDEDGGNYLLKKNKIGSIVLGLTLFMTGIHELTPDAWLGHDLTVGRICMLIITIVGGPAVILAGFTTIKLDTIHRTLERRSPIGLGNKIYLFDDFNGIQTVRKSFNFIYSGTEVQLVF